MLAIRTTLNRILLKNPNGFQNAIEAILSGSKFEIVWEPNYGASVATLWSNFARSL